MYLITRLMSVSIHRFTTYIGTGSLNSFRSFCGLNTGKQARKSRRPYSHREARRGWIYPAAHSLITSFQSNILRQFLFRVRSFCLVLIFLKRPGNYFFIPMKAPSPRDPDALYFRERKFPAGFFNFTSEISYFFEVLTICPKVNI